MQEQDHGCAVLRIVPTSLSLRGVVSDANASAITLSSFFKDDRWHDFHRIAQRAGATSLTAKPHRQHFHLERQSYTGGQLGL